MPEGTTKHSEKQDWRQKVILYKLSKWCIIIEWKTMIKQMY